MVLSKLNRIHYQKYGELSWPLIVKKYLRYIVATDSSLRTLEPCLSWTIILLYKKICYTIT
jgi:hypothetical protein